MWTILGGIALLIVGIILGVVGIVIWFGFNWPRH